MEAENEENTCVVCFKGVEIYSVGQCDHPVCYECSTRMRVLCRQNECPICRQDMPKVIFTKGIRPYRTLQDINGYSIDKKFKIVFETEEEKKAFDKLLAHECPKCSKVFMTFSYLRDHVRRVHQLNYCDLCVDNIKIYSRERRCYTRAELTRHRKEGDPDNRSHRGHPLCEFCDTRYVDNDELYRHLRRDHLYCHFCDADGLHQYYRSYDFLRDHFRAEHFLCEEGECVNEKFTAVFRTEIDLKAHRTTVHGRGLGKAGLKQARTLELEFTLAPRPRPNHHGPPRYRDEESRGGGGGSEMSGGGSGSGGGGGGGGGREESEERRRRGGAAAPELRREEDFPALGGDQASSATSVSLRLTSPKQPSVSIHTSIHVNHPHSSRRAPTESNYNHHFPALGVSGGGEGVAVTSVSWSAHSGGSKRGGGEFKPPPGLPHAEEFPSLSATRTSTGTQSDAQPPEAAGGGAGGQARAGGRKQPAPAPSLLPPPPSHHLSSSVAPPPSSSSTKPKKKKSKSGKAGVGEHQSSGPPLASPSFSAPLSINSSSGESKSKKNKKETKTPSEQLKQERVTISTESYENNNNNSNYDVENIIKSMSIEAETQKNYQNIKKRAMNSMSTGDDFPTLGAPPGFSRVLVPPAQEVAPRWEIKKPPKPPPGLGKPPPPPGLAPPGPPPGFSGLNGGFPPLIGGPPTEELNGYIAPNNFAKRNSTLVKLIGDTLVGETLQEFKEISVAFRNGSLFAPEYYAHCRDMLGPDNFKNIFPELLALLPDITKQQELWATYKVDKRNPPTKRKGDPRLEECATCGQILLGSDLKSHLAKHGPPGSEGQAGPLSSRPGQVGPASNPWAKLNL